MFAYTQTKQHEPRLKGKCSVLSEERCWMYIPLATNYHTLFTLPPILLCVIQIWVLSNIQQTKQTNKQTNTHTYIHKHYALCIQCE